MNTYAAGKDDGGELPLGSRAWVFGALATPRFRDRINLLAGLSLTRRPDCEPTLRALVTDQWTPETQHHLGWCESCRTAGFAVAAASAAPLGRRRGRRALMVAVVAGIAIGAPLAWSQLIDDPFSQQSVRGGLSHPVAHHAVKPVVRSRHTTHATHTAKATPAVHHVRKGARKLLPMTM